LSTLSRLRWWRISVRLHFSVLSRFIAGLWYFCSLSVVSSASPRAQLCGGGLSGIPVRLRLFHPGPRFLMLVRPRGSGLSEISSRVRPCDARLNFAVFGWLYNGHLPGILVCSSFVDLLF
jgi:hypothetical protein